MKSNSICRNMNNKGITLIALVVTIIILIILAGVSINIIMDENGLIQKAKEQKITQAKAEILQELELAKGPVTIEGSGYTSLEKYLEHINKKGLNSHNVTSITEIDEENAEILVDDKYIYTVAQIGNNVIINEIGKIEETNPETESTVTLTGTTSTSISFSGSQGGKTSTVSAYLPSSVVGKTLTATVSFNWYSSIFNGVYNQKGYITCGDTTIYIYDLGSSGPKYETVSETKTITFTPTSTELILYVGATKSQNPNQGTQWIDMSISIGDVKVK